MRILIAEDDAVSRLVLLGILEKWGLEPVVAEDGDAAWATLQRADAPKLVLLDRNMPGLEGLEVCRRLRRGETSNPAYVILLTARGEKADIVQGLEAGANDYVAKPFDNEELQARIRVGQRMLGLQARLVEARDALAHQALHDPLTGLFNRRAILTRLSQEISRARREGGRVTVGMCDIDHFKRVNDSYGHQVGDEVLMAVAERFRAHLREYDSIGRYGGEEFLATATSSDEHSDASVFQRLCARVAGEGMQTRAGAVSITISIGVAGGTGESTVDSLLAAADTALYQAKADGRNRVVYAKP